MEHATGTRRASIDEGIAATSTQQLARLVLAIGLILLGLWILQEFLAALAWAAVFAIAIWPLHARLCHALGERDRPIAAPLLITMAIALLLIGPLVYGAIAAGREAHVVVDLVGDAQKTGIPAPDWLARLPLGGKEATDWWNANLGNPLVVGIWLGHADVRLLAESAREYGGVVAHKVAIFVFTLLILFFLFRDGSRLVRQMLVLSDRLLGEHGERLAFQMVAAVQGTVTGLVLVGLAEGVLLGIAYLLAGLPHPMLIGALTGIAAIIPFAAPIVFAGAALYLFATGAAGAAAFVFGFGFVVLFIADHFVRPILIGGAARLPFLWVLLGILGGLQAFGLLGLFFGPAVLAALISLWRDWTQTPVSRGG
jgi:predicted PurR-regulated permease PerM